MDQDGCERNSDRPDCSGLGCGGTVGVGGKSSDAFIDRSRVRILLCDNNLKSSEEAFTLLCKCSYQVTSVKSARQVIDALNAEGPDIDIILSEVDLPMAKGMKMLKYITRDKDLRRIPVIMMSAQDEVSVVVKCLRLGAADYLVKPLRTNELLNLWTHMWRRRRMLGLAEKNIMNYEFDLVASDPSDANTNSTTLFSDDTDDKSRKSTNPEICITSHQEDEFNASGAGPTASAVSVSLEPPPTHLVDYRPHVPGVSNCRTESFRAYKPPLPRGRQFASCPKKSELRIGESSAFFTYVKSSLPKNCIQGNTHDDECRIRGSSTRNRVNPGVGPVVNDTQDCRNIEAKENQHLGDEIPSSSSMLDSLSVEPSPPPPAMEFPQLMDSKTEFFSQVHMNPCEEPQPGVSNCHSQGSYPYYIPGLMNQVMMPQYPHVPQCPPHVHNMASFPYYPVGLCLQPSQIPPTHPWPSLGGSSATDVKLSKANRREAALTKFRQKRKERCFDKKIRYVNRKRLAERRPRVRGQFVRKANGVGVDLNGHPGSFDLDEEEDEEDEEENMGMDSSPEDDS